MIKFLGRKLDPRTMTYTFADGSGSILPEEMLKFNGVLKPTNPRRYPSTSEKVI